MRAHIVSCGWFNSNHEAEFKAISQLISCMNEQANKDFTVHMMVDQATVMQHVIQDKSIDISEMVSQKRITLGYSDVRHGAMRNYCNLIGMKDWPPEDVVIMWDMDDRPLSNCVGRILQEHENGAWVTHGSFQKKSGGATKLNRPYKNGNFRGSSWRASHVKSFRHGLWKYIRQNDFKDRSRRWLQAGSDLAIMFPVMELAGHDRVRFIQEVIYEYDDTNPLNDHKVAYETQKAAEKHLRSLPRYKRLESL